MKKVIFIFSFILFLNFLEGQNILANQNLTMEQRIKAQEAIERVYYEKRIWPKENPNPKPPFEEVITQEILRNKVEDYIKKSILLEEIWQRPITGEQLQAEMDRMVKNTKDPETLKKLFDALGDDPYLIAETLARQTLADRLIRNWYAFDERFHGELKKEAENLRKELTIENFEYIGKDKFQKIIIKKEDVIYLKEEEFERVLKEYPEENEISEVEENEYAFMIKGTFRKNGEEMEGGVIIFEKERFDEWFKREENEVKISLFLEPKYDYQITDLFENNLKFDTNCEEWKKIWYLPDPRAFHTAVWTGSEMIVWGGAAEGCLNTGGRYNPATDTWTETNTINVPSARAGHTAVWTGIEMIIWGGADGINRINTGGRYNPLTDTWTETSTTNAPSERAYHTAVWTGTEMIVWGGYTSTSPYYTNTGGRYNPSTDTWTGTSTTNAPSGRYNHTAVWTGSEMIVWGGAAEGCLNTGGRYNPATDTWTETNTINVPSARAGHTAVWTGIEMIIWGGADGINRINTGGRYNPLTDTWTETSTTNAPSERAYHTAVWTGTEMIVWGGYTSTSPYYTNTGGRYNPSTDTWTGTSTTNAPSGRYNHTAVWTGSEMIVWGGGSGSIYLNTGGLYNPTTDIWTSVNTYNAPSKRRYHTAIWTGTEMIVWGGYDGNYLNTGGRYNPLTDTWIDTSTTNAPSGRYDHTAVWTGTEMIVWGGYTSTSPYYTNTGGRYNPSTDTWTETSTTNAPSERSNHTAVWTGSEMIVWGGHYYDYDSYFLNTGGRYNPSTNAWTSTSITNAPSGRSRHTAVWAGSEMVVWGGYYGIYLNTGGRYNPSTDTWVSTSTTNAPSARDSHTAVWTGTEMIVWGGSGTDYLNTGGTYNPLTDIWFQTSTINAPSERRYHTAIWTGESMVIWGGIPYAQSGGIYKIFSPFYFGNINPQNNSVDQKIDNLLIDWDDSRYAISYDLYFGTENPPPLYQSDLTDSQFILHNLSYNTVYYWYVVSKNSCGETIGQKWSFKTCTLLSSFNNLYPQNLSNDHILNNLLIDWEDVEGAIRYDLYLGPSSPPSLYRSNISESSLIVNGLEPGTTYYWYVVAKNNCEERAGDEWSFTTCNLLPANFGILAPENNAINISNKNVLLDWEDSNLAETYNLYFGTTNPPPFYRTGLTESEYTILVIQKYRTYYWYVEAVNYCGTRTSEIFSFKTYDPDENGPPASWGYNNYGQLGNGSYSGSNVPVQVLNLTDVIAIAGGYSHSLALKADGTVWAWGRNGYGQLGNGNNNNSNIPVQVLNLTNVIAISGGYYHSLALKSDGTVWAWGDNYYGQLGNGNNTRSNVPVQVLNLTDVIEISGGGEHSLALKADGTVWAWGYNYYGQLGNENNNNSNVPVQVLNLTDIIAISAGGEHSLALRSDGTIWAWGDNNYGQLGNGNNNNSNVPVQVQNLTDVTGISGGYYHSLALKSDGTVWSWGNNDYGQLGNGNNNNSNVPVQVISIKGFYKIDGGYLHSIGLRNDGTVWAWGANYYGQLGNGSTSSSNVPVNVLYLTSTFDISAGGEHSLSISCPLLSNFSNYLPQNYSTNQKTNGLLIDWQDSVNATSYDLYLGTTNPPPLYQSDISESQFIINGLQNNTTYYWYVVAKNSCASKQGSIWQFTTGVPLLAYNSSLIADNCAFGGSGDENGIIDPGETINLTIILKNTGPGSATGITGIISSTTPGVTILTNTASFPDIINGETGASLTPFVIEVSNSVSCETNLNFAININSNEGSWVDNFILQTGLFENVAFYENFDSAVPPALPSNWATQFVNWQSGDQPVWKTNVGTRHPSGNPSHSTPNLAYFNSWDADSGSSARLYYQIPFNFSAYRTLELSFWMYHDTEYQYNLDYIQFQVSTNEGASWTNVGDKIYRYDGSSGWKEHKINLNSYAGQENVMIGFLGVSDFGNDLHIDDVRISGTGFYCNNCIGGNIPKVIPDGSGATTPVIVKKNNANGTELEISWDGQCNPQNANIIYGDLSGLSSYQITGSKCAIQNPDTWVIGETSNIWFVIVSDNGAGTESSWGYNSSGQHRNGTNASLQCGNSSRDNSGTCP
ncbi:MAG: hypothetical protein WHV67_02585 [Thermoanaerobaculia bacterium]